MADIPNIEFSKKTKTEIEFEIFTLSSLFARQGKIENSLGEPHRVEFYNVIYITKGSGCHHIDFNPYPLAKGCLAFVSKGQVHAFDVDADMDGYIILFTDEFLTKNLVHADILSFYWLYNYHLQEPIIDPEAAGGDAFNAIVHEMYWEYLLSNNFAKEEILRLLLKLLLLRAERIKRIVTPNEKNTEWLNAFSVFKNILEKEFAQTRNAGDYANMMAISYKHLNAVCRSITGITAKAFIDQFLILEAKRRLAVSDISVKELTYALGFDEPTNFVKFFKKHTLQSPSQFKKKLTK